MRGLLFIREVLMKKRCGKLAVIFLATALVLNVLGSCTSPMGKAPPTEITDQLGRTVALDKSPQRIISLAPSNTEILFALGLADRVVAVTDYCNYPPEAEGKASIGGFSTPNIEEIVVLSPDLILATSMHEDKIIPQLESKGLIVVALNPETVDEVISAITLVGQVTGTEEKAASLLSDMRSRIKAVTDKTNTLPPEQRPSTCYIVWHDPLMIANFGTLQDELINKAGGLNTVGMLSSKSGYAEISLETFIAANPAVIIAGAGHGSGEDQTFQYAMADSRLREIDARQNDRVYAIDSDLASRPGPRIVDGLELFAQFIHPELFQ